MSASQRGQAGKVTGAGGGERYLGGRGEEHYIAWNTIAKRPNQIMNTAVLDSVLSDNCGLVCAYM